MPMSREEMDQMERSMAGPWENAVGPKGAGPAWGAMNHEASVGWQNAAYRTRRSWPVCRKQLCYGSGPPLCGVRRFRRLLPG